MLLPVRGAPILLLLGICSLARGADWPQHRFDAGRGAVSPEELPARLHLQWVRRLPEPRPAWPASQPALRFDVSYSPVAAGGLLFVPSMVTDTVTAYDAESGAERWRFYADGPIRLAPVTDGRQVWFGSDDGHLYCVGAADGRLRWRVRGGPSDRRVLGNDRLISTWPIRGGPVLADGRVYFTAGIWPFMGIYAHAVEAATGKSVWINSGEGANWTVQPHNSPAFAGFVPRGHLAATPFGLVAPGGRTQPGCYDLKTGRLSGFGFGPKNSGTCRVTARSHWCFAGGAMREIADGRVVAACAATLHDTETLYGTRGDEIFAERLQVKESKTERVDRRGKKVVGVRSDLVPLWTASLSGAPQHLFLKAGSRFYAGEEKRVVALKVDPKEGNAEVAWQGAIEGVPWTMLAADGRLFVVTVEGRVYCFGANEGQPTVWGDSQPEPRLENAATATPDPATRRAQEILRQSGATEGYCVLLGAGTERLTLELVRLSGLHVIVIDPDPKRIDTLRREATDAGLYGGRIAAHVGDPAACRLPPYLATLAVVDGSGSADASVARTKAAFHVLRPYGGMAWIDMDAKDLGRLVVEAGLAGATVKPTGSGAVLLVRSGALPGAADWTHQYADAANTVVSQDELVKAPLGLLWFGGPSNDEVLPRHGHGPSPQVAAGRLVIEGRNMLRALDIYTGRLLWQKTLPDLGTFYDNTSHQPGAGEIGSNYVTLPDVVYVAYGDKILVLDPATGQETRQIALKPTADGAKPQWGFLAVSEDLLLATSTPVMPDGAASDTSATVAGDGAALKPIINRHASWKYLTGADPAGDWTAAEFDAKDWKTGEAGFGYGDDDDRTKLAMKGRFGRVYVRNEFDAKTVRDAAELALVASYDDAFIAYLNGREVIRAGVGRGRGKDASQIRSHEAGKFETFPIDGFRKLLRPGKNVLAIEGHNVSLTSSDFSLDPYLAVKPLGKQEPEKTGPAPKAIADRLSPVRYASASRRLVVYDRRSSRMLWDRTAQYGFRHNNIAMAGDRLFCIDGLSQAKQAALRRRGVDLAAFKPKLLALDARTGKEIWSATEDVFGTFLSYSAEQDVLLQAGSAARDRAKDEAAVGMVAYRGADGRVLWKDMARKYSGPCMILGQTIITQGPAYSLLTGKPRMRRHPLSDEPVPWTFTRNYGCNTAIGCRNLITFRSAAAGFYDLARDGGTGNLGGFKSSCTSNLIAAGGLLCAPEYTRTCTCTYQNQTSLAMVHDPGVEMWTFNALAWSGEPIRRIGVNFGAPGDRRDDNGTLWLEWPASNSPSPEVPVEVQPEGAETFRHHSGRIRVAQGKPGMPWVAASGIRGVRRVTVTLARQSDATPRAYTVRLHFAEVDGAGPGERVFDVRVHGKVVLAELDIVKEAGPMTAVVKEIRGVQVGDKLTVEFVPTGTDANAGPLLGGIEVVAEGK